MGSLGSAQILGHWAQFSGSLKHNSKNSRAITLKLGTDACPGSGNMPIHFGVSGLNFDLGSVGSIMGSLDQNSNRSGAINLEIGTDTFLGSGKMPIHFGVNLGVTGWEKVKISLMGISCSALRCYISTLPMCTMH